MEKNITLYTCARTGEIRDRIPGDDPSGLERHDGTRDELIAHAWRELKISVPRPGEGSVDFRHCRARAILEHLGAEGKPGEK